MQVRATNGVCVGVLIILTLSVNGIISHCLFLNTGLQYITEYRSNDNPVYECHLCLCQAGVTNMFMHVLGIKHRMAYLVSMDVFICLEH